jgi:hypothetical protein
MYQHVDGAGAVHMICEDCNLPTFAEDAPPPAETPTPTPKYSPMVHVRHEIWKQLRERLEELKRDFTAANA